MSEVIGSILLLSVTLVVGFAAWAWASGAAQSSELNFGNAVSCNIQYLKEAFVIVNVNFSSSSTLPSAGTVTVWLYNNGNTTVYIKEMWISNSTWSPSPFTGTNQVTTCGSSSATDYYVKLPVGSVTAVTLSTGSYWKSGSTYQFEALGVYGNTNIFQQTK